MNQNEILRSLSITLMTSTNHQLTLLSVKARSKNTNENMKIPILHTSAELEMDETDPNKLYAIGKEI